MNNDSLQPSLAKGIANFENTYREKMEAEYTATMETKINQMLRVVDTILIVTSIMNKQPVRYVPSGMRTIQLTLMNGRKITVTSACFILYKVKGVGRPRQRRKNVLVYPALELFGFIDKKSPAFLSMVVRAAVSSSSFQAASDTLRFNGIKVSPEQVRKITYKYADLFIDKRVENALDGSEKQAKLKL